MPLLGQTSVSSSRVVDLNTCVVAMSIMQTVFFMALVLLVWRYGRPREWPTLAVCAFVLMAFVIAFVWWWIDKAVEGDLLIQFAPSHSLTAGDLLAVPALATAALVVVTAFAGRARDRSGR